MNKKTKIQDRRINWYRVFTVLGISLLSGFIFGVLGYVWGFSTNLSKNREQNQITAMVSPTVLPKISPIQGWKVYTSPNEKASFRYPESWSIVKSLFHNNSYTDAISLKSPDGKVTINWVSIINGLGGGCGSTASSDHGGCPFFTFIDKTPTATDGLYVISGTLTTDEKTYKPFLAVQDNSLGELLSSGSAMAYDEYVSHKFKTIGTLFSTGSIYADGPALSKADAYAWFNKPFIQQAKQILQSLTY